MTIKYGVRHYKEVGAFLAFKDKLFESLKDIEYFIY